MSVIRKKPGLYSHCQSSFLCASVEAAQLVGINAAIIFNNLLACAYEPNIGKVTDENGETYYPKNCALAIHDLDELMDVYEIQSCITKLCVKNLIKIKIINDNEYYKILYEE